MLDKIFLVFLFFLFHPNSVQSQYSGALRLWRNGATSSSYTSGRVQVFLENGWGNVCGDLDASPFRQEEADVTCRNLGYTASSHYSIAEADNYGIDTSPTVLDDVSCPVNGYHLILLSCAYDDDASIDTQCTDADDVGILCYTDRIWFDPYPGMVRLSGGEYSNEGIVQVYCNGAWGRVCNASTDANVICTQLGYTGSPRDTAVASVSSGVVHWFNSLDCSSDDAVCVSHCTSCPMSSSSIVNCAQSAYVYCEYNASSHISSSSENNLFTCDTRDYPIDNGAVRLMRNGLTSLDYTSGIVQVFQNGQWTNICRRNTFSLTEAHVLCHQLGYSNALNWSFSAIESLQSDGHIPGLTNVMCSSSELLVIHQCSYDTARDAQCTDGDDIIITCDSTRLSDNAYSGMIRLVGSEFVNEGEVEVYCNGVWGTVCNDSFDVNDAVTLCRQLGYNNGCIPTTDIVTGGDNSRQVWLNNLLCSSGSSCISSCASCPSIVGNISLCSHEKNINIQCFMSPLQSSTSEQLQTIQKCQAIEAGVSVPGALILYRNGTVSTRFTSGRVVVYSKSLVWGNVCRYSSFSISSANVICHQLGYTGATYWSYESTDGFGIDARPAVIQNVACLNYQLTLFQCNQSSPITNPLCTDNNDIGLSCYQTRIWDLPYPGMIRLVNGLFSNEGRLEVYCSGVWGTVCANSFDGTDATVLCRQLGYASHHDFYYTSDSGNSTQPIWLNNLQCTSASDCISDCQSCPSSGSISPSCTHSQDVHLRCTYFANTSSIAGGYVNSCRSSFEFNGTPQSGALILTRNGIYSRQYTSGRVVLYGIGGLSSSKYWGNICRRTTFSLNVANVICHQLSYTGASTWAYSAVDQFGVDTRIPLVGSVSCSTSRYTVLLQCSMSVTAGVSSLCTDNDDISVTCYTSRVWNSPYSGQVRLSNGNFINEGLLEVYCNGEWGTVCDTTFSATAANVVCRQLGYAAYYNYEHLAIVGATSRPIWLSSVATCSSASCISSCQSCPSNEVTSCVHAQDVTITCYSTSVRSATSYTNSTCLSSADEGGLSGGGVAGIVIASITVISIIIFIIIYADKKKKTGRTDAEMFRAGWESIKSKFQCFHCNFTARSPSSNANAVQLLTVTPSADNANNNDPNINNPETNVNTSEDQAPLEAAARPAPPSYFEATETAFFSVDLKDAATNTNDNGSNDEPLLPPDPYGLTREEPPPYSEAAD